MLTQDETFFQSLMSTLIYVFMAVPMKLVFALFLAVILNMKLRQIILYRTVFYLPSILGASVVIAILWRFLFAHDGLINNILSHFSIPGPDWLGNPKIALFTLSLLHVCCCFLRTEIFCRRNRNYRYQRLV